MSTGLQKLTQSELDEIIRKHMRFISGIRGGARAVVKFKDLSGLHFRKGDLSQADFTGSILINANMSNATFKGVSFFACDMRGANLENACFARADFRGATVVGANLTGADFEKADMREGVILERNPTNKTLSGSINNSKAKTIFSGSRLSETNLSGASANYADFSDADLSGVIGNDADFSHANFEGANLSGADFTGSNLKNANMKSSIISGTKLDEAETAGLNMDDALTEDRMGSKLEALGKTLEQLLEEHTAWIATAGKSGTRLDLSGYDLRHVLNLKKFSLTAVKAVGANFLNQDLQGASLQSAVMDRADFRDTKLANADFRGTSLKNGLFSRANLVGANLSPLIFPNPDGSKRLQRVNLSGANLRYAILSNAVLADCLLVGADLSYAVMHDCDLRRADLTGAILDNADFHGALLNDVISDRKLG